jgi:hypothetical protein
MNSNKDNLIFNSIFNVNFNDSMYIDNYNFGNNFIVGNYEETRKRLLGQGPGYGSKGEQAEEILVLEEVSILNINVNSSLCGAGRTGGIIGGDEDRNKFNDEETAKSSAPLTDFPGGGNSRSFFKETPFDAPFLMGEEILVEKALGKNFQAGLEGETLGPEISYRKEREIEKRKKDDDRHMIKETQVGGVNYPARAPRLTFDSEGRILKAKDNSDNNVPLPKSGMEEKGHKKVTKKRSLKILHWNANSVIGKNDKIIELVEELAPDVISFNETRTDATTEFYIYKICTRGYIPFIKSRPTEKKKITEVNGLNGGGVALLIRDGLTVVPEFKIPEKFEKLEAVGAQIRCDNKNLSIFSWYIPPEVGEVNKEFLSFIENQGDFILMGDLNSHIRRFGPTNASGKKLDLTLQSFRGAVVNEMGKPTFYRHVNKVLKSTSTIDLVLTDERTAKSLKKFETHTVSPVYDKKAQYYHVPVTVEFEFGVTLKKERISFHSPFLYDKANWQNFQNDLEHELLDETSPLDIESENTRLMELMKNSAAKNIPRAKEGLKRNNNFPPEIVAVLKNRNYWGRMYRKNRDEFAAETYKIKIALANDLIAKHKHEKWKEFIKRQGKSPLSSIPFWRRINRLRESKRKRGRSSLLIDGQHIQGSKEQADIFANNLEKKFSDENSEHFDGQNKAKVEGFMENDFNSHFSVGQKIVKEFTMQELTSALKIMNAKTSMDPYGLSNKMFKHIGFIFKENLLALFNRCLKEKQVPGGWRHSVVTMLLKSGQDPSCLSSYRPISMTPCIARLFERLVLLRLQRHLKSNHILISNQSGFRERRQTKDNLFYLIQKSQEGFNDDKKTLAIFFDVAAAFDKVWHMGLIYKLVCLKVPYYLIMIIWAFLKNRTFVVKVEGVMSGIKIIICGVPQGGVLSPTLFSIYVNDVPLATGENEKTLLFADDIVYIHSYRFREKNKLLVNAKKEAQNVAQKYLGELESWMSRWRLSLAPHKCAQITLTKARDVAHDGLSLKLYNKDIPEVENPKFLGIVFDRKLKFTAHVDNLDEKIRDRMNILKILSYDKNFSLDKTTLVNIYKSLIRSVMDYACVTLAALSVDLRRDFEVIQNNAIRIIFNLKLSDETSVDSLREMARVTSIEARHTMLMDRYYESALTSANPLVAEVFEGYKKFKRRKFLNEGLAWNDHGSIDIGTLDLIRQHNKICINEKETYPTNLCKANKAIRDLILDNFEVDGAIT